MSIKDIITKSMANDPMGLKESLEAELTSRVSAALEEKVSKMSKPVTEEDMVDCPHCEGTGMHEQDGEEVECPECEGTGKVAAESVQEAKATKTEEEEDESDDEDDDDDEDEDEGKEKEEAILTKAARREKDAKKAAKKK